jgi:hypothetical protein
LNRPARRHSGDEFSKRTQAFPLCGKYFLRHGHNDDRV